MAVIPLAGTASLPLSQVGGKAQALGRLMGFGAPVPPGFVVEPELDLAAGRAELLAAFDGLGASFVAVRSSGAGEDAANQSWAGQFDSYLYVQRSELLEQIEACRRSGQSVHAKSYGGTATQMDIAVIVQRMVASDVAGVLFSVNPISKNPQEAVIEAVYGLCELLVQGLSTPDNFVLDKSTGKVVKEKIAAKTAMLIGSSKGVLERPVSGSMQHQPTLNGPKLRQLLSLAVSLEAKFGYPLDMEWAYEKDQCYIVQARPITTL
jgi:pyruvate,water dikinase